MVSYREATYDVMARQELWRVTAVCHVLAAVQFSCPVLPKPDVKADLQQRNQIVCTWTLFHNDFKNGELKVYAHLSTFGFSPESETFMPQAWDSHDEY